MDFGSKVKAPNATCLAQEFIDVLNYFDLLVII